MRRLSPLLLACALACSHRGRLPDGTPAFYELTTEHFILTTDLPEGEAREVAVELENVRAALIAGSWHGNVLPRERLRIVELADLSELHEYVSPVLAGVYIPSDLFSEPLIVMSAEQSPSQQDVLKHELAHHLNSYFLLRSPRWFNEGLAAYLQTLRYDSAESRYLVGEPDVARLRFLRQYPETDFAHVLTLEAHQAILLNGKEMYSFESAGWLIVYYLANQRRAQLNDYIQRLAHGEDPDEAFKESFGGETADQLARDIAKYQQNVLYRSIGLGERQAEFRYSQLRLERWKGEVAVRLLPAADVHALRAELYFLSPGLARKDAHLPQARAAVEEALKRDPGNPLALLVRFGLADPKNPATIEDARAATRLHSQDFRAWSLLARMLRDGDDGERRAALEKATQLAPDNPATLNALAWDHVVSGRAEEALPIAVQAAALAPGRSNILDTLAAALALAGRCPEALRLQERAVELIPSSATAQYKASLNARLDAFRGGCKLVPLR